MSKYGCPEDPLEIQELENLRTQVRRPDVVELMAKDWAELLQLVVGFRPSGHGPWRGLRRRTVHKSGRRAQPGVVEHRLRHRVRRGGRSARRGVIVEAEVSIGWGGSRALAILPGKGDARSNEITE